MNKMIDTRPRGIRNNNPGNIRDAGIPWRGLVGRDAGGYAVFDTALHGIRAMAIDLRTGFVRDGEDTVREIIAEWAPAPENDTVSYVAHVASILAVEPDTVLDYDRDAPALIGAIILHENGEQPYPRSLIEQAIAEI